MPMQSAGNSLRVIAGALCLWFTLTVSVSAFETRATAAYVLDVNTGTVLLEKNADVPLPPASMSKLMTLNMLFEALQSGIVTMDTKFRVSPKAAAKGGSKMFLREGSRVAVRDLIPGIIVQSGNDACIVVAEGLAGDEDVFAAQMTARAVDLGMTASNFVNSSGWPDPGQRMSMRDLGTLALRLMTEFPEYYPMFSQRSFTWDGITQNNRNPLLGLGIGADGLKTGHTEEAGYGLVGSARQGERRIIFVITGLQSEQDRADEGERIINWAFRQFVEKTMVTKGTEFAEAELWMGESETVPLVAAEDLTLLLPILDSEKLEARVEYEGPIEAPIEEAQPLGELIITGPNTDDQRVPLIAANAVERGGFMTRVSIAAQILFQAIIGKVAEQL